MGLLNYTTEIAVDKTIGEIYGMLGRARVNSIAQEMDGAGNVTSISFQIETPYGRMGYRLPANVAAAAKVLNEQARKREIPGKFLNDIAQARRVAWRCIRQWIEAQLALVQIGAVSLDQAMLPYSITPTGETLYERLLTQRFTGLALNAPREET